MKTDGEEISPKTVSDLLEEFAEEAKSEKLIEEFPCVDEDGNPDDSALNVLDYSIVVDYIAKLKEAYKRDMTAQYYRGLREGIAAFASDLKKDMSKNLTKYSVKK